MTRSRVVGVPLCGCCRDGRRAGAEQCFDLTRRQGSRVQMGVVNHPDEAVSKFSDCLNLLRRQDRSRRNRPAKRPSRMLLPFADRLRTAGLFCASSRRRPSAGASAHRSRRAHATMPFAIALPCRPRPAMAHDSFRSCHSMKLPGVPTLSFETTRIPAVCFEVLIQTLTVRSVQSSISIGPTCSRWLPSNLAADCFASESLLTSAGLWSILFSVSACNSASRCSVPSPLVFHRCERSGDVDAVRSGRVGSGLP